MFGYRVWSCSVNHVQYSIKISSKAIYFEYHKMIFSRGLYYEVSQLTCHNATKPFVISATGSRRGPAWGSHPSPTNPARDNVACIRYLRHLGFFMTGRLSNVLITRKQTWLELHWRNFDTRFDYERVPGHYICPTAGWPSKKTLREAQTTVSDM